MRKFIFIPLLCLFMLAIVPASATDTAAGVFRLASHVPAQAGVFVGVRIDDAHIAAIDGVLARFEATASAVTGNQEDFPDTLGVVTQITDFKREDLEEALSYTGDHFALANLQPDGDLSKLMLVIELTDRAALEARFVDDAGSRFMRQEDAGRYHVYFNGEDGRDGVFMFADDLLMVFSAGTLDVATIASGDYPKLADDADFQTIIGALPAESYNIAGYASRTQVPYTPFGDFTMGGMALAATIIDGTTLTLDAAFGNAHSLIGTSINPDFSASIPAGAGAVIHSANIRQLINGIDNLNGLADNPAASDEINEKLAENGLSLADLYAWSSSDFAFYLGGDFSSLATQIWGTDEQNTPIWMESLLMGGVFAVSDPAAAQTFKSQLDATIKEELSTMETVTFSEETVNGVPLTVIRITPSAEELGGASFVVAYGTSDTTFAIGAYSAVTAIFNNTGGINASASYQDAMQYWLASPSAVLWIDGVTLANLALVNTSLFFGRMGMQTIGAEDQADLQRSIDAVTALIRHATITAAASGETALIRATLSLTGQ